MGNYVVVGGSKGIGFGLVQRLIEKSNSVTVLSRTKGELENFSKILNSYPRLLQHVEFDVTKDEVKSEFFPESIDGLAYCPGSLNLRTFRTLKPEMFRDDFELNVMGAVRILQAALPKLNSESTPASVLLFSTVAVGQGMFAHASIAASKGAIEGLTRSLAAELAPHVRVNCIAPALTSTAMTSKFFANPEKVKTLAEKYPLARAGTVDDVANLAYFLLANESSWITGQVIGVDGGMSTLRK